ncbi:MAG TPA: DUF4169 family protein [Stellaceae bacterium]|nr:DUF4169 family protein [Stellaceae bacterium]
MIMIADSAGVARGAGARHSDGPGRGLVMASVVNLNRFRKARQRTEDERRAAENRATFGRSKAERQKADSERERIARDLDGKQVD